jgi:proteasome lid subunit RPN8/RPN11
MNLRIGRSGRVSVRFSVAATYRERMLRMTRAAYDAVVDAALDGRPEEVCGVLAGERDGATSRVASVHPVPNVASNPTVRYALDPEAQFAAFEAAEADGHEVVGFYHSHPTGPPRLSETDVADAAWPGHSYVICSLDGHPYVGSWRWRGDAFERESVVLVD